MKKLLLLISLSVLLFASCKTITAFDESIPEEKTARIMMGNIGVVTEYNGISVKWERPRGLTATLHQIPAGDTVLQIDVDTQLSVSYNSYYTSDAFNVTTTRTTLKLKGAIFRYNFLPKKEYYFDAAKNNDEVYGLKIYAFDYDDKNAGSGTPAEYEAHYVTFVPFKY
jgi:hypothetical protein